MKISYKIRHSIMRLSIALAVGILSVASIQARGWELTRIDQMSEGRVVVKQTDIEIRTSRGMIMISTNHPIQIKVYSILGQLVTQANVPAGTSRLTVAAHGVYIVKVGDITCKVAV